LDRDEQYIGCTKGNVQSVWIEMNSILDVRKEMFEHNLT